MDSLVTLAICVAIGLSFEPGWRLHPGARGAIAEEQKHHHHEHHSEEGSHGEHEEAEAEEEPVKKNWVEHGRDSFGNFNTRAGTALFKAKDSVAPRAANFLAWLRSPAGIEVAVPYALLSATWMILWGLEEAAKTQPSPAIRPVSPLAPKLQIGDQSAGADEPFDESMAAWVFFFGIGLGLGVSRVVYRWGRASEDAEAPRAITVTKAAPVTIEANYRTAKVLPVRGKAGSKSKVPGGKSPRDADAYRHNPADEAAGSEDIEGGEDKRSREKMPEEYDVWTPQTSWTGAMQQDTKWTPQVSWADATFSDVRTKQQGS